MTMARKNTGSYQEKRSFYLYFALPVWQINAFILHTLAYDYTICKKKIVHRRKIKLNKNVSRKNTK